MRKIIDGKRYDTAKAERLGNFEAKQYGDAYHVDEDLYRTSSGRLFLHGEGGGFSRWGRSCGNGWQAGADIVVLTDGEARAWLENAGETDALERFFSIEDA